MAMSEGIMWCIGGENAFLCRNLELDSRTFRPAKRWVAGLEGAFLGGAQ